MELLKSSPGLLPRLPLKDRQICSRAAYCGVKTQGKKKLERKATAMSHILQEKPVLYAKVAQAALELKQNGWTVLDGVLDAEECAAYLDGCWRWLEGLGTGVYSQGTFAPNQGSGLCQV